MSGYLAIDPGETNGAARFNSEGLARELTQFPYELIVPKLCKWIKEDEVTTIIVEKYFVFPHKAKDHIFSDLKTVKAIGKIEAIAEYFDVKMVLQEPNIKKSGYNFMGTKPKATAKRHQQDALAHGIYYLVTTNVVDPVVLLGKDLP